MIGTNCSGTNAVKYGTMKDWVINLTVVLADGTVIKTRRRPRKSSAGYNLNGLFVGSEGTLGLVTEATLKLTVIPEEFSVAVVTFPSIRDAASAAAGVMQTGIPVAAMEIMDEVQMKVVNMGGATAPRVWKEMPTLFFKFSGTKAGVKENISLVQRITKANNGSNFEFAKDAREQKLLWSARKESLWSMLALRKDGEEVCKLLRQNLMEFATNTDTDQGAPTWPFPSAGWLISSRSARRRWTISVCSPAFWATSEMEISTRASSTTGVTRVSVRRLRRV
jgi:D-lactate dehydrogenase (cytochrome)